MNKVVVGGGTYRAIRQVPNGVVAMIKAAEAAAGCGRREADGVCARAVRLNKSKMRSTEIRDKTKVIDANNLIEI
ncbi:unnamed protein product [Pieris macdunnoughi]|uniref:Uncharacterized protein n=1 Tax=Pieris macdunnoughi TaxID=345717 RepID=A0A821XZV5_9NEOP|nr:unnamed protein product [Pieris macdunnoughi]